MERELVVGCVDTRKELQNMAWHVQGSIIIYFPSFLIFSLVYSEMILLLVDVGIVD